MIICWKWREKVQPLLKYTYTSTTKTKNNNNNENNDNNDNNNNSLNNSNNDNNENNNNSNKSNNNKSPVDGVQEYINHCPDVSKEATKVKPSERHGKQ